MRPFSLNIRGTVRHYDHPVVMGILNVTPDSFYDGRRYADSHQIGERVRRMLDQGVDIIDIGGCSTRPGFDEVTAAEELRRIERGMRTLRDISADIPVSVDTYRSDVARQAVTNLSVDMVNDVTGGDGDPDMYGTVAELGVPYVLTHSRGGVDGMHRPAHYDDVVAEVVRELAHKISELTLSGVNDIIVDPGFGFGKDLEQNYALLSGLDAVVTLGYPVLVGVSRKSMVTRVLGVSAEDALNGTTALNTMALERGASVLRVHDVAAARQIVRLTLEVK